MAQRTTRIISKLGPGDELQCTVCEKWKPAEGNFRREKGAGGRSRFFHRCKSCSTIRDSLRQRIAGKVVWPTKEELVAAVNGLTVLPVAASLKSAGHATRNPSDPSGTSVDLAKLMREARERSAGLQGYLYLVGIEGDTRAVKVGYSVNPEARIGELQTGNPWQLTLLAKREGTLEDERKLHMKYIGDNLLGEWFRPSRELMEEFDLTVRVLGTSHMVLGRRTAA